MKKQLAPSLQKKIELLDSNRFREFHLSLRELESVKDELNVLQIASCIHNEDFYLLYAYASALKWAGREKESAFIFDRLPGSQMNVPPTLTGLIVGKKGRTVQGIEKATGARIQVEPDGLVKIFSPNRSAIEAAKKRIEELITLPEIGEIYEGKITRIRDLGAYVKIIPGKEGFLHRSRALSWDELNVGDHVKVKLLEIDLFDNLQLSEKAARRELDKTAATP